MNIGFYLLSSDRPPGAGKVEGGAYFGKYATRKMKLEIRLYFSNFEHEVLLISVSTEVQYITFVLFSHTYIHIPGFLNNKFLHPPPCACAHIHTYSYSNTKSLQAATISSPHIRSVCDDILL